MADERVVFEHVVEGIVRAFGPRLTSTIKARWRELGIPLEGKGLPAYPIASWARGLDVLREELNGSLPVDDGYYALGRQYIDGYFATRLGGAMSALMKVIGPTRAIRRLTQQFRTANNFATVEVQELGPNWFEIDMNGGGHPHFTRGLISRGIQVAGAKDLSIELIEGTESRYRYRVRWS